MCLSGLERQSTEENSYYAHEHGTSEKKLHHVSFLSSLFLRTYASGDLQDGFGGLHGVYVDEADLHDPGDDSSCPTPVDTLCTLYDRKCENQTNGVRSKVSQPGQVLFRKVYRFLLTKISQSGVFFSQKPLKMWPIIVTVGSMRKVGQEDSVPLWFIIQRKKVFRLWWFPWQQEPVLRDNHAHPLRFIQN